MTRVRTAAALALLAAVAVSASAQEKGEGPASLVLLYKCKPEHRPAFRTHMAGPGLEQFEAWKAEGRFRDYLALFSSTVSQANWDMLVRLDFDKYADTARWYEVERTHPGGLAAPALALCSPIASNLADLTWSGGTPVRASTTAMYYVIPYDYESRAEYKTYVDAYVTPQTKGWVREGILNSYAIYLNQNDTGPNWDSLFILEYKDLTSLARTLVITSRRRAREVRTKVRAELGKDAAWKTVSDLKHGFRKEGEIVIAEPLIAK